MSMTTPLKLVYVFDDGDTVELASGTIDSNGVIAIQTMKPGEEESVETVVAELNAAEQVYVRGMADGEEEGALTKLPVERGMPGFLPELVATAQRFFNVELRFDETALEGPKKFARSAPVDEPETDEADELLSSEPDGYGADEDGEFVQNEESVGVYRS